MVGLPLDSASINSYKLSIVTMPLNDAVCRKSQCTLSGGSPIWRNGKVGRGPNWYRGVVVKQPYLFLQTDV